MTLYELSFSGTSPCMDSRARPSHHPIASPETLIRKDRPARYSIKAHEYVIIKVGCLIIFLSKHGLYLHIEMAKHMAAMQKV
jgi:hypothetical protein